MCNLYIFKYLLTVIIIWTKVYLIISKIDNVDGITKQKRKNLSIIHIMLIRSLISSDVNFTHKKIAVFKY